MTSSSSPLPPPTLPNLTLPSHNIYYQHHGDNDDDDNNHPYYPQQPSSSNNPPSPHSRSRNESYKNASYNPHPNGSSNSHHIVHLPQPQLYFPPPELPNAAAAAAAAISYRAPQSMTDQNQDHRRSHSHAIERITIPHPASMSDQTHAPQIQTRREARRSHGHNHNNHGVLMSGHSSPRAHQVDNRGLVYADDDDYEEDDGDDDEHGDEDEDDGLDVVRSTETENAFFILLRLSFLVPPLTLIAALYTLAVLLFLLFALPLHLCTPSPFFKSPLSAQICSLLLPLLRRHQRLIAPQPRSPSQSPRRENDLTNNNNVNHNNSHNRRHYARYRRKARRREGIGGPAVSTHPYDTIDSHQQKATTTTTTATTTTTTTTTTANDTQHAHLHTHIHGNPPSPPLSSSPSPRHSPNTPPPPISPSPSPPPSGPPQLKPTTTTTHSPAPLLLIHILSPTLIPALLIAAWIAASFWIFAMILGNPDGTERRDDGRVAVLGVRNWWWRWLCWARKERGRGRDREREREKRRGG